MFRLRKRHAVFLCALVMSFLGLRVLAQPEAPRGETDGKTNSAGFRLALPGYEYSFPRDHGAHPEFATEWWYYTGHLKTRGGAQSFGYQLTFFRTALVRDTKNRKSAWAARDVIFGHFALTDKTGEKFYFTDRISRANLELAGADASASTPRIWLDDWSAQFDHRDGNGQSLRASGTNRDGKTFALQLVQRAAKNPVIHGENGISQKSAGRGRASHYYSFTRLQTSGTIAVDGTEYLVSGQSWFDHEFGSNQLSAEQTGWDWFSLQLDDGRELMLYQLRLKNGDIDPYSSGTLVEKNGVARHLKRAEFRIEVLDFWTSPRSGAKYPARWKLFVPGEKIEFEVIPTLADQELDTARSTSITYWEGSTRVRQNNKIIGRGYVELTGYAEAFNGTF